MSKKIKVYGEIINHQDPNVTEWGYCNLTAVQKQLEEADGKDIIVGINSPGGNVDEGFAIYSELRRYAKQHNAKITTISDGQCASIATIVFLAGDERILNRYISPFVHNAWTYAMGDANELNRVAADLEVVNDVLAKFYAEHTDLTYEEARELMDDETFITPEEAVNIRFATMIEDVARPAALQRIINNKSKDNNNMAKNKVNASGLSKTLNAIKNALKGISISNLLLYTSTNEELEFPDLEDDATPSVGDKATLGGEAANGEVTLQDGTVYVFENGTLTEIKEASTGEAKKNEVVEEAVEIAEVKEDVAELENDVEKLEERLEELAELVEAQAKALKKINDFQAKLNKLAQLSNPDEEEEEDDDDYRTARKNRQAKAEGKKGGLAAAAKRLKKDK